MQTGSTLTHLVCSACKREYPHSQLINLCECGKPLLACYDLKHASKTMTKSDIRSREKSLWKFKEVLPVQSESNIISLGEGGAPLLKAKHLAEHLGISSFYIKDEAVNPTASFKARGMALAVSRALELGAKKLAVPSAGNAAGALAAYAARAQLEAFIFMPRDTPKANIIECQQMGAHVTLIDGLITDCGAEVAKRKQAEGWFDVSTLKEPYRIEGKKTLGYELAEQLNWKLPDVILYPTGGGTGLIGMWKAFDEMEAMGWIDSKRPRMFTVQAEGCAPIVTAFKANQKHATEFLNAHTLASGLRVPKAIGDFLILDALRKSSGGAISVPDEAMLKATKLMGSKEGVFAAPEGAACLAALEVLLHTNQVSRTEEVVLFNTGSGLKYLESYDFKN